MLDDPWAERLAEADGRVEALRQLRHLLPPLSRLIEELQLAHCVRHASVDALVAQAAAEGYADFLSLGSGYCARPLRLGALAEARWIEVDQGELLARKQAVLGASYRARALPLDLARDPPQAAVGEVPGERPLCLVLEGILHYLPRERWEALFTLLARRPGRTRVILSAIDSAMYQRGALSLGRLMQLLGEVPRLHFAPAELRRWLARQGFVVRQSLRFEEQQARYAAASRHRSVRLSQRVVVAERPG